MTEGFLKHIDNNLYVYSAGTNPASAVSSYAVKVMKEKGIDISLQSPTNVDDFVSYDFDYVITVCDNAKENCPIFSGNVRYRKHIGFEDPADAVGTDEEILNKYREVRDLIFVEFEKFYNEELKNKM